MENKLIRYIRNKKNNLRGVIVATKQGVGWSLCCKKDAFDKKIGINIAFDRAIVSNARENFKAKIPASIADEYFAMEERRQRYFKDEAVA